MSVSHFKGLLGMQRSENLDVFWVKMILLLSTTVPQSVLLSCEIRETSKGLGLG